MNGQELQHRRKNGKVGFIDEMPAKPETPEPPVRVHRLVFGLIFSGLVLFGGIGTWAYHAPIQGAVVAGGSFEVDGDLQVVQHLEGGIVREILVHEGDAVAQDQVIAVLDETRVNSQIGILYSQLGSALARVDRLKAEYARADEIVFSDEVVAIVEEYQLFDAIMPAQIELFNSNRVTENGRTAILMERIGQLNEQMVGIEERNSALTEQRELVSDEVRDLQTLLDQKLTTKARFISRRRIEAELIGDIGENESRMSAVYQQVAEMEERILQVRRDRNLDIADKLQTLQEQIYSVRQRLEAALEVGDRLRIRAPIAGRIVGFGLNTVGEVIQPGQTLLKIVPEDSAYIVEAQVRPDDIDEVKMGGDARVRLSAYSYRTTPPIDGTVVHISADSFYDTANTASYYMVRIAVSEEQLASLANVRALPSMPVQVMIATREQTVITYLIDPVLGSFETALVEGD